MSDFRFRRVSIGAPPQPPQKVLNNLRRPRDIVIVDRQRDDPGEIVARFLWPVSGEWLAAGSLAVRNSAIEVTGLSLLPVPGNEPGRITSELLRAIPIGEICFQAQMKLAADAEVMKLLAQWTRFDEDLSNGSRYSLDNLAAAKNTTQGRPTIPDEILRLVAETYLAEMGRPGLIHDLLAVRLAGDSAVKIHLKGKELTTGSVRYWIRLAERRGFLGPGHKGTRRRAPGPRMIDEREPGQVS